MTPTPSHRRAATCAITLLLTLFTTTNTLAEAFPGWQTMRIIEQDGYPYRLTTADLNNDNHDELLIVNTRQARLEIYSWLQPEDRKDPTDLDDRHPNDLPMAPEIKRTEIPISQLPHDVLVTDADSDNQPELYVLVTDPNRVLKFTKDNEGNYTATDTYELRAGRQTPADDLLLLFEHTNGIDLLISYQEGIQRLPIQADDEETIGRTSWIEPRESLGRNDWWLADLDNDGDKDLIEWTTADDRSLRWYPVTEAGLLPAQVLHDRSINGAVVVHRPNDTDELVVLESNPQNLVRRYQLTRGETQDLGQRDPLALAGAEKAVWAVANIDNTPKLVAIDPEQPRATLYTHDGNGWIQAGSYPVTSKVKALLSPPAEPGAILLWSEDAEDLFKTHWADGRLTFPQPLGLATDAEERLILGLGRVADTTWWIQRVDDDIHLGIWNPGSEPTTTIYPGVADKAENAIWLGTTRLLVLDKFARSVRLVTLDPTTGEATSETPSHLARTKLEEFRLYPDALGRITEGVLQWLDDDLHAKDQVMLPDGLAIADLVLINEGFAWALEQGGAAIHGLAPDSAGVLRVVTTTRTDRGRSLSLEPGLGLLMTDAGGVTRMAEGRPLKLEVIQSIDSRSGRPTGTSNAAVHRVLATDIDNDNQQDIILADDVRHQLTLMTMQDDQLQAALSWPVFEDQTYPYGGQEDQQITEPRRIVALDIDGDGLRDLALLSQDRLLLYLAREPAQ
ncbi:hypothetical protein [Mucisphaera sp.]|uniref:hypothetical protein n=1 Tax=Mucisphaera sp. TaxID=2913024 RepID=UPI003D0F0A1A